jgi:hypothetical protein
MNKKQRRPEGRRIRGLYSEAGELAGTTLRYFLRVFLPCFKTSCEIRNRGESGIFQVFRGLL